MQLIFFFNINIHCKYLFTGDVDGSLEAIMDTLDTYKSQECRLDLLHYAIGSVTENDIEMAAAFEG